MALVVFLRGVNVGGHRTFQPSALAKRSGPVDIPKRRDAEVHLRRQEAIHMEQSRLLPRDHRRSWPLTDATQKRYTSESMEKSLYLRIEARDGT
jgi:hypothetical protein